MKPIIAIIGAGAVGCYYGGRLAEHGNDVHFLFRSGYDAAQSRGLIVRSLDGDFTIPPDRLNAHTHPSQMPKADLVIVTLKTTANDQYQPLIAPLLHDQTVILTLQNGLGNEARLAELFGRERILGGLAFVCINRLPDGTIHHLDHGTVKIGQFHGPLRPITTQIADWFSASKVPCQILPDLLYGRWEKLVWNVPFNGLGAVMSKTTDQLIATPQGRALVKSLMMEIIQTAATQGVKLPPEIADLNIAQTRSMGAYRTSMQIDKQENRPLETESILHQPLAAAQAAGIATPYLKVLYDMASLD
jgi:2-dehydropantoate 2-reductase